MRCFTLLFLLSLAASVSGQFEQRLSLNLSAGAFSTIGYSTYVPENAGQTDVYEPSLMTNFKPGFSFSFGIQYNLNRHLSIEASFSRQASNSWYFDISEANTEANNYLFYEILSDPINYIVETSGENELYLSANHFRIAPRYYFLPGKKFNPFATLGLNFSFLDVFFDNNEYKALLELGRENEYEANPAEQWHDNTTKLGFNAGIGAEYALGDKLGIFIQASYHMVILDEYDFYIEPTYLHYHSLDLNLGVRISFLKSKDI